MAPMSRSFGCRSIPGATGRRAGPCIRHDYQLCHEYRLAELATLSYLSEIIRIGVQSRVPHDDLGRLSAPAQPFLRVFYTAELTLIVAFTATRLPFTLS
jgi:hypothetical protein